MEPYKHVSIAEAYRSIYTPTTGKAQADQPHETLGQQYSKRRDEKLEARKAKTLKVEAADLAYVLTALIEDGTVSPDRVKELMKEKLESGPEYHARMKEKNKEPINPYPVNKDGNQTVRRNVSPVKGKPKINVTGDMTQATNPRPGSNYRGD